MTDDADEDAVDVSADDCACENRKKMSSITSTETGVTLHTAYRCLDCGREFID